jgi:hypothetical protein
MSSTARGVAALFLVALGAALITRCVPGSAASLNLTGQGLTEFRTCTITATPAVTTSVRDASVRQGSPGTNFGTATTDSIASASGANRRLYLWFDLAICSPAIPASATIRLATLRLFVSALPSACRTIDVFRVTSPWTEPAITWTNQPFGTAINNPPSASATDTFTIGTPVGCQNRSTSVYVVGANPTADVSAYVSGGATNLGWMLRDDVEGSSTARTETLSAKELGSILQAPQLVVTYATTP